MENNTVKKDNRKAFPKYLLILFVSAIFGGVLGFAAGWIGHDNLSEVIATAVADGLTAAAPWALLATSVVSLGLILWLYRSAKALFTDWDGEDDDTMDRADEKLNWALLLTASQFVLDMFFFAVAQSGHNMTALWSVLFFIVSAFALVFAQQKVVDLTRRMNPEKKGSVYDVKIEYRRHAAPDGLTGAVHTAVGQEHICLGQHCQLVHPCRRPHVSGQRFQSSKVFFRSNRQYRIHIHAAERFHAAVVKGRLSPDHRAHGDINQRPLFFFSFWDFRQRRPHKGISLRKSLRLRLERL